MEISKKTKSLIKTIFYYLILFGIGFFLDKILPADMCNPGVGMFALIFIGPILTIVLIFRNLKLLANGQKDNIYSLFFHIIIILSAFIALGIYS